MKNTVLYACSLLLLVATAGFGITAAAIAGEHPYWAGLSGALAFVSMLVSIHLNQWCMHND